ncbi:MAG: hypothetical protein DMF93_01120 [Acidobacteria bacterium]|nr:MAG: hypothetical protein DMF93_01120 [Acidobacteriota bacterium]
MDNTVIYLLPIGSDRFALYAEAHDDGADASGFWRAQTRRLYGRWRDAVREARNEQKGDATWLGRARDWTVRRTADAMAEQRALWTLRRAVAPLLVYPADLSEAQAAGVRDRLLARARAHHARWLVVDALTLAASGVLVIVPGPNVIAYYFAFRVAGHFLSWRGARRALQATAWRLRDEPALAELRRLAALPRDARAPRLDAIAAALKLPRLADFFDRTAAPAR